MKTLAIIIFVCLFIKNFDTEINFNFTTKIMELYNGIFAELKTKENLIFFLSLLKLVLL